MKSLYSIFLFLGLNTILISQNYLKTTVKLGVSKLGFKPKPDLYANAIFFLSESDTIVFMDLEDDYWKVKARDSIGYINKAFVIGDEIFNKFRDSVYWESQIKKRYRDSVNNAAVLFEQKIRDSLERRKKYIRDSLEDAKYIRFIKRGVPIYFVSAEVNFNSIGTPEANLVVKNISKKVIDAYEIKIYCYDRFDRPVRHYATNSNVSEGISQEKIGPNGINGSKISEDYYCCGDTWTLYGHDTTTKIKVYLSKVHFTDGTRWISPALNTMTINGESDR